MKRLIQKNEKIAFICSFCLGDTLMSLVTVNNFLKMGYQIHAYGDYAFALKNWFPQFVIHPLIKVEDHYDLKHYDVVLHMYESELSRHVSKWHPCSITLSHSSLYKAPISMTDIQVSICKEEFGLSEVERVNNVQAPSHLGYRKWKNRIVMHPTSSLQRKNWPAKKFMALSQQLMREGYEISFIVSPDERKEWEWVMREGIGVPALKTLDEVAQWMFESGYFIGNDSGLGHLASNLGIPTVSIILRKGVARQWRPTWAPGKVVLSPTWLNPRPIKEKLWKVFTRVASVKAAFDALSEEI